MSDPMTWEQYAFIAFAVGSMAVSLVWSLTYKIKKKEESK